MHSVQSLSVGWSWKWFATDGTLKQQSVISNSVNLTTLSSKLGTLKCSGVLQSVIVIVKLWGRCAQLSPIHTRERVQRRNWRKSKGCNEGDQWMCCSPNPSLFLYLLPSSPQAHLLLHWSVHAIMEKALRFSTRHVRPPHSLIFCWVQGAGGAVTGYSLSMSLYFFRSMDTWSLKRTGSSLIWEWTRGMVPNQLANLFMQVWRWAKWSGSAQRDARELWGIGGGEGEWQREDERAEKKRWRQREEGRIGAHWGTLGEATTPAEWIMHRQLSWPFTAYCNYSWVFLIEMPHCNKQTADDQFSLLTGNDVGFKCYDVSKGHHLFNEEENISLLNTEPHCEK